MPVQDVYPILTPGYDLGFFVELESIDATSGRKKPAPGDTVNAYLALARGDAAPANPVLVGTATYQQRFTWLVHFDANVLPDDVLNGLYGDASATQPPPAPIVVIEQPGGIRGWLECRFVRYRQIRVRR